MKRVWILALIILFSGCTIIEPQKLLSKQEAVILIHGLGATPYEVQELQTHLESQEYKVYTPLLAGHGETIDALRYSTWEDWYATVQKTYDQASLEHKKVHVVGMSAGGNLALLLAAENKLESVTVIAPALYLQDSKANYALIAKYFINDIERDLTEKEKPHYSSVFPARTIGEWVLLSQKTKKTLKNIEEPILIVQSLKDPRVNPKSSVYVYERVRSQEKETHYVNYEQHVLIKGKGSEKINQKIEMFIST